MRATRHPRHQDRAVLITGGAGFIGSNLADALAARGTPVVIFDNMSRSGAHENAAWLHDRHPTRIELVHGDVREPADVGGVVAGVAAVLHLAAQVAVTTSLHDPIEDFEINARGTLNVLEAIRLRNPRAPLVFASTNKVYGELAGHSFVRRGERYMPADDRMASGVSEAAPLDLHSPYGCSKGAADQYVRDYARVYGLRTAVLRMSCVYGPRQFGTEDQGWVAHFMLQAINRRPITIYGDGYQVRDVLHVEDAVAAWLGVLDRIDTVSGRVFNLGGGAANATSLLELLASIATLRAERPAVRFDEWRPGDQPWYVSDTSAIGAAIGWRPRVTIHHGLPSLARWLDSRFGVAAASAKQQEVA
jgi:CDP-paratose 2-epimerase